MHLVVSDLVYNSLPKASTDILTDRRTTMVSSHASPWCMHGMHALYAAVPPCRCMVDCKQ